MKSRQKTLIIPQKRDMEIYADSEGNLLLTAARATAEWDSDVDIAILVERPFTPDEFDKLADFVVDMDLKYDKVFSVIDIELEKFKKWSNVIPFYRNVEKEGIVLWKAA